VHEDLVHLKAADGFDRRLVELKRAKQTLDDERAAAEAAVAERAAELEHLQAEQGDALAKQKALARDIEKYERRMESAERVLAGGGGDPEAAERQIAGVTEQLDRLETELLEQMERADALSSAAEVAQTTLDAARTTHEAAEAAYGPTLESLRSEFESIVPKRDAELAALDATTREKYLALRDRKGSAVAPIVRNACKACRMVVQQQHLADLKRGLVVPCRGCGRWLVPEESG
jgi:predicted  nucleic acid-binding Zn-ribbon protein